MHLVFVNSPPPRILPNHCFQVLGITVVPREIENNSYTKFFFLGGGGKGKQGPFFPCVIGIKYKCLSQSCFSTALICCGLLSITVRLDGASNQSLAKPMKIKQTNVA